MDQEKKISEDYLKDILTKNFLKIMPVFYEMQSTFLSGIYKRYGNLEGANIVIYFAKNLHLEILRRREEDLDFNLSLDKFWLNHKNVQQPQHKVINVSKNTGLPKETTRRKIIELVKKKHIKKIEKNQICWEPIDFYKDSYIKIIDEEINYLSKFIFEETKILNIEVPFNKIQKEIRGNFSFYWYHYLDVQLRYMRNWQDELKDLELLVIILQCIIQTINYMAKKKSNFEQNGLKNFKMNKNMDFKDANISATSVSEVTGIPRATCIRKLESLVKDHALKKDLSSKRYHLFLDKNNEEENLVYGRTGIKKTIEIFSNFSAVVLRALLR